MKQTDKNFFDCIPQIGTKELNNLAKEMVSGKPKSQTAVELLIEQIKSKKDSLSTNTKEERMAKGIYVDCLIMARETKEIEKQQLINFHIETMKIGLIKEGERKWLESYKPKITKIAEEYYNKTFKNQ